MKQKKITSFFGEYGFLSNFWPCDVEYDGLKYPSVEHAYQAAKTDDMNLRKTISELPRAMYAKRAGNSITPPANWHEISIGIMYNLVKQKFTNNNRLKGLLLATGDAKIVEGNTWGDVFWGVCNGVRENHLGEILMKVRQELFDED